MEMGRGPRNRFQPKQTEVNREIIGGGLGIRKV